MRGKLITIEGIDGSGKGTQALELFNVLNEKGCTAKKYSFPAYGETFFGKEVGAFLRGEFGSINEVHPKLASILYACDRLEQKPNIIRDLENGFYVICDRYIESNIAYQISKLSQTEYDSFYEWLITLEYKVNGMPKPDLTIFLDVPLSFSKELVMKKKQRSYTDLVEDIHEREYNYLDNVYNTYQKMQIDNQWEKVSCIKNDIIKSVCEINFDILNILIKKGWVK